MQKDSYDFDTKRKYHEKLEQFIRRFYDARLRKKKHRDALRVACFPWHEGLEVLNVYDKLGIPRENIVGIERDADTAQRIEDLKLGIKVENKTDAQFFEETADRFDIVNLDYQGILTKDSIYVLQLLGGRPALKDKAILGTNFLGKREADRGDQYRSNALSPELVYRQRRALEAAIRGSSELIDLEIELAKKKENSIRKTGIGELRDDAITTGIIYALLEGKSGIGILDLERTLLSQKTEITFVEEVQAFKEFLGQFDDSSKTPREKYDLLKDRISSSILNRFFAVLSGTIRNLGLQHKIMELAKFPENIACYVMMPYAQPFFPAEIERGRYVSDHGSPMLFDFMYVKRLDLEFPLQSGKIRVDAEGGKVELLLTEGGDRTYANIIDNAIKLQKLCRYTMIGRPLPERQFLGSSYQPKSKDANVKTTSDARNTSNVKITPEIGLEAITESEAKLLLETGCAPQEIAECYSGFTIDDLVKMQTPVKKVIKTREEAYEAIAKLRTETGAVAVESLKETYNVEGITDKSLKAYIAVDTASRRKNGEAVGSKAKLDGQAIIDDLAILSEEQVREKYNISAGQIRAIKAHQTMGAYKPPLQQIQYIGATIEGRGDVLGIVQRLEKRYNSLEQIPHDQLEHHKIKIY